MMLYALMLTLSSCVEVTLTRQDLVFSVELHLGRIPYPLSLPLDPYPLVMFLSRNLGEDFFFFFSLLLLLLIPSKSKAGVEPGQAQLKLGLDCTLIAFRFYLSRFGWIYFVL